MIVHRHSCMAKFGSFMISCNLKSFIFAHGPFLVFWYIQYTVYIGIYMYYTYCKRTFLQMDMVLIFFFLSSFIFFFEVYLVLK